MSLSFIESFFFIYPESFYCIITTTFFCLYALRSGLITLRCPCLSVCLCSVSWIFYGYLFCCLSVCLSVCLSGYLSECLVRWPTWLLSLLSFTCCLRVNTRGNVCSKTRNIMLSYGWLVVIVSGSEVAGRRKKTYCNSPHWQPFLHPFPSVASPHPKIKT